MFAAWRQPRDFLERMDASFFATRHLQLEERLKRGGIARRLGDHLQRVFKGAFYVLASEYSNKGVPFIRVADITSGAVELAKATYLPPDVHEREAKTAVQPGDLLFAKGGSIGNSAVVPVRIPVANISQDVIGARVRATLDAYFAQAFLSGPAGVQQMTRWAQGNVHPHITNDAIRNIWIPVPGSDVQRAIGNKLRKAERLREQASAVSRRASARLDAAAVQFDAAPARSSWVHSRILNERLDAQPYRSHFRSLEAALKAAGAERLGRLAVVSGGDPVPSEQFTQTGVPLVRIRDIQQAGFDAPDVHVSQAYFASRTPSAGREFSIVVGMDGEFRAQFFIASDLPRLVNQRVAIIDCETIRPELLVEWLNRAEGQLQLARWTVQTTVAHTSLAHIRNLLIPRLPHDIEATIADDILEARRARAQAPRLVANAIADVEAFIDGTLDEPTLLAESAAIETWLAANPSPSQEA